MVSAAYSARQQPYSASEYTIPVSLFGIFSLDNNQNLYLKLKGASSWLLYASVVV